MFSHMTLGTNAFDKSVKFYTRVLEPLGISCTLNEPRIPLAGFSPQGQPAQLFVVTPYNRAPATAGNGTHVAFLAQTRDAVDRFHAACIEAGGTDEGGPGLRSHYHEHYYGAYARDPDGNKIQACCHAPE